MGGPAARGVREGLGRNSVYLTMHLNGQDRAFLLDSGCDMTLLPLSYVKKYQVKPTIRTMRAANGADIPLAGEVRVLLFVGDLRIDTPALVSEFVSEGMLGHDWMRENNCYWGFRAGQMTIQGKTFELEGRGPPVGQCYDLVVPSRSEAVLSGKMMFDHIGKEGCVGMVDLITRPGVMDNGLYFARVVVPHHCTNVPVRLLNVTERDITLKKGAVLSDLESVTVLPARKEPPAAEAEAGEQWKEELMSRVSREVEGGNRRELRSLLTEYADCFSKSEFDLGRTTLVTHQIDTGDSRPIRQTLRRQPLRVVDEIDRQVSELGGQGMLEPAAAHGLAI